MGVKKLTFGQTSTDFYWLVGWLVGWLVVSRKFSSKKARNKVTIRELDSFPQTYEFKMLKLEFLNQSGVFLICGLQRCCDTCEDAQ